MSFSLKPGIWVVAITLLIICIAAAGCSGTTKPPVTTPQQTTVTTPQQTTVTTPQSTPVAGKVTVDIKNFAFSPQMVTIAKESTVTWVNQDAFEHEVVNDASGSTAQGAIFNSGSLGKGASYSFTFNTPGVYPYHCSIHPSMTGTITVT